MTMAQRVATIAIVGEMKDTKFEKKNYIDHDDYFIDDFEGRKKYLLNEQKKKDNNAKFLAEFEKKKEEINKKAVQGL